MRPAPPPDPAGHVHLERGCRRNGTQGRSGHARERTMTDTSPIINHEASFAYKYIVLHISTGNYVVVGCDICIDTIFSCVYSCIDHPFWRHSESEHVHQQRAARSATKMEAVHDLDRPDSQRGVERRASCLRPREHRRRRSRRPGSSLRTRMNDNEYFLVLLMNNVRQ